MSVQKWYLNFTTPHGLSDGQRIYVSSTGYAQIDDLSFAVDVVNPYSISLLDVSYVNNATGIYPDSAYVVNTYNSVVTSGTITISQRICSGLTQLIGCTVSANCDGLAVNNLTVASDGSVDFGGYYSNVIIGLPYTSILEPMGLDSGGEMGTADNQMRRIRKAFVRVQDTFGMQYGCNDLTDTVTYHDFLIRDAVGAVSDTTDLQTGVIDCELDTSYMRDPRFVLKQSNPLPMNVLGITYLYENSETQVRQNQQ